MTPALALILTGSLSVAAYALWKALRSERRTRELSARLRAHEEALRLASYRPSSPTPPLQKRRRLHAVSTSKSPRRRGPSCEAAPARSADPSCPQYSRSIGIGGQRQHEAEP